MRKVEISTMLSVRRFTMEDNLRIIIKEITENQIVLPDFQRQFDWSIEKQRQLIASVMTKLPVGSILLLQAQKEDYKIKTIGIDPNRGATGDVPDSTLFLLDGQQRLTCLTNVFSDVIHEASEQRVSNLASRSLLANRFYLRLNRWSADIEPNSPDDLFGMRSLSFRFDVTSNEDPDFFTADILDYIECRGFYANDYGVKPYMPFQRYGVALDDYCFDTPDSYLIPLFLLVGTSTIDSNARNARLITIINRIAAHIRDSILSHYTNLSSDEEKDSFVYSFIVDETERESYENSPDKASFFQDAIYTLADIWKDYFKRYLESCVCQLKLNRIIMPTKSRARAIDIYENLNMGGLSLSTLDLLAARVAIISNESLYTRIFNCLKKNTEYNLESIPEVIRNGYLPENYNASTRIKALSDKRTEPACQNLFIEVLGLYCNNMNYEPEKAKCEYSKSSQVLKLKAEQIDSNCEVVCRALDRAFCFLQTRCGIRTLGEVNYKLMIRLIAYIFTNDEWYNDNSIHNKLEAWYWSAVFSGEYDKDQNNRFENNLKNFLESFTSGSYAWIIPLKDNVLETDYFSECGFMLMEKVNEDRIPKDHLRNYFCHFYLSRPYSDLINDDKVSVFIDEPLEMHHIIPLGSVSSIGESTESLRKDNTHIANSPLNFVYITEETNGDISDKSLQEYQEAITSSAKSDLAIVNYPSTTDLNNNERVRNWLRERHEQIQGRLISRIDSLLI